MSSRWQFFISDFISSYKSPIRTILVSSFLPSFGTLLWRIEVSRIWTLDLAHFLSLKSFPSLPSSLSWLLSLGPFNHVTLRQYLPTRASILSPQLPKNLISLFLAVPWSSVSFFLLERGDGFSLSIFSSMLKTNHLMSRERPGFADYR